jgi:histidine ammonia-lyase
MGGFAARKSGMMLENMGYVLGIELMCALQALDLKGKKLEGKLGKVYGEARKKVRFLEKDGYFGEEIEAAKEMVMGGLGSLGR